MKTKPMHLALCLGAVLQATAVAQVQPKAGSSPVSLIELKPIEYKVGHFDLMMGAAPDQRAVLINGEASKDFIFAHAPSQLTYEIPTGATKFTATGTMPTGTNNPGTWFYVVKIDGNVAFESRTLQSYKDGTVPIEVIIPPGSKQIELSIDAMKDNAWDHSVWAVPYFDQGTVKERIVTQSKPAETIINLVNLPKGGVKTVDDTVRVLTSNVWSWDSVKRSNRPGSVRFTSTNPGGGGTVSGRAYIDTGDLQFDSTWELSGTHDVIIKLKNQKRVRITFERDYRSFTGEDVATKYRTSGKLIGPSK